MPGRRPKPTKLRVLEGNPGKRPLPTTEPQPIAPLACPDHITGRAAEEWKRAVAAMPPGFFTAADAPVLELHCVAWAMWRDAQDIIAEEGLTARGYAGQPVPHPAAKIAAAQSGTILRAADHLGMSPSARARLGAPPSPGSSDPDDLICG